MTKAEAPEEAPEAINEATIKLATLIAMQVIAKLDIQTSQRDEFQSDMGAFFKWNTLMFILFVLLWRIF